MDEPRVPTARIQGVERPSAFAIFCPTCEGRSVPKAGEMDRYIRRGWPACCGQPVVLLLEKPEDGESA